MHHEWITLHFRVGLGWEPRIIIIIVDGNLTGNIQDGNYIIRMGILMGNHSTGN